MLTLHHIRVFRVTKISKHFICDSGALQLEIFQCISVRPNRDTERLSSLLVQGTQVENRRSTLVLRATSSHRETGIKLLM